MTPSGSVWSPPPSAVGSTGCRSTSRPCPSRTATLVGSQSRMTTTPPAESRSRTRGTSNRPAPHRGRCELWTEPRAESPRPTRRRASSELRSRPTVQQTEEVPFFHRPIMTPVGRTRPCSRTESPSAGEINRSRSRSALGVSCSRQGEPGAVGTVGFGSAHPVGTGAKTPSRFSCCGAKRPFHPGRESVGSFPKKYGSPQGRNHRSAVSLTTYLRWTKQPISVEPQCFRLADWLCDVQDARRLRGSSDEHIPQASR